MGEALLHPAGAHLAATPDLLQRSPLGEDERVQDGATRTHRPMAILHVSDQRAREVRRLHQYHHFR